MLRIHLSENSGLQGFLPERCILVDRLFRHYIRLFRGAGFQYESTKTRTLRKY